MKNIYQENGYKDREEYLESLSEDFNVDIVVVKSLALLFGESEDFDGLVSALVDLPNFI